MILNKREAREIYRTYACLGYEKLAEVQEIVFSI